MNEIATRECMPYYITLYKGLFRYILTDCSERPTKVAHAAAGLHYAAEQKQSSPVWLEGIPLMWKGPLLCIFQVSEALYRGYRDKDTNSCYCSYFPACLSRCNVKKTKIIFVVLWSHEQLFSSPAPTSLFFSHKDDTTL